MACLDDEALAAWHEGRLKGEALLATRAHVDSCDACQRLVAAYEGAFGGAEEEKTKKEERYRLIDLLGAGAMGIVHRAHDSELDREVALKVLRAGLGIEEARLVREARAMAKLRHANAVTVFDAGRRQDGTAFVAMELIEGSTLREWLSAAKRPIPEILRVFAQAADALAAAHVMFIVHRDFKPDNVLVTKTTGDAKVADFGLAGLEMSGDGGPISSKSANAPLTKLTKHGAVIGTPAYMAPEQHDGKQADARADQFAFFVSLFEALTGIRPFPGDTPAALRASIARSVDSKMIERLPRELRDLVATGLHEDPKRRHASMKIVADRLRSLTAKAGTKSTQRTWMMLAAPLISAFVVAGIFVARNSREESTPSLTASSSSLPAACVALRNRNRLADEDKKAALDAFTKTKLPFASDAHARFVAKLDAYVGSVGEACTAATPTTTEGEAQCLELLREDASNILKHARKVRDRVGVEGAIVAARSLESPAICRGAMRDLAGDAAVIERDDPDGIARMLFELRTVVAPPTPSMSPPTTKRGLLSLMRVLRVRVHEPHAFEEEAEWDAMNETIAALPGLVKKDIEENKRSADRAAERALAGDAGVAGAKAVKPRVGDPVLSLLTRAIASATQLHLESLRAEALFLRSEHAFEDPSEEVIALVSQAPRLAPSIDLLAARRTATTEGRLAKMVAIEGALRLDLKARAQEFWAEALLARGELVRDRPRAEIDTMIATADEAWGAWHSRAAQARVQAAEWLVARGMNAPAQENASAARDVWKEMTKDSAFSSSRRRAEHAALHARALAVLAMLSETNEDAMKLLVEAERIAPKSPRPSYVRARIFLDRVHDSKQALREAQKAQGLAVDHPVEKAEADALLAEATAVAGDRDASGPLFAKALTTVSLLSPPDRARLRLSAARRLMAVGDLGVARALAEQAEADDPEAARTLLRELKR